MLYQLQQKMLRSPEGRSRRGRPLFKPGLETTFDSMTKRHKLPSSVGTVSCILLQDYEQVIFRHYFYFPALKFNLRGIEDRYLFQFWLRDFGFMPAASRNFLRKPGYISLTNVSHTSVIDKRLVLKTINSRNLFHRLSIYVSKYWKSPALKEPNCCWWQPETSCGQDTWRSRMP